MPSDNRQSYSVEDIYNLFEGTYVKLIDDFCYIMALPSQIYHEIVRELLGLYQEEKWFP